ncbi:MAG: site-specific tyrosine recombinase XerD [Chloroflexi bacterium]|nr:site-specific tyrosine recombinase XerD [Chloroflexota bacterium]
MQAEIAKFLHFLSVERGFSENTLAAYRNDLTQFYQFVLDAEARQSGASGRTPPDPKGNELDWSKATRMRIISFILQLKERRYAPASVARKIAAVKSFFHFLTAEGMIPEDPTENLASPKVDKVLPQTLTIQEVDELLEQPARLSTPEATRDKAMLEMLYATGMRVSELMALDLADVDLSAGYVRCVGRGARERIIPIRPQAIKPLEDYLQQARPILTRHTDQQALFVNHRGERLTRQGFWLIVKSYAKQAKVSTNITPNILRHSFATHMLHSGADLHSIQEMLGHASITTTQIYTHLPKENISEAYSSN